MAIIRLSGDLPPDLEVELYRETSGETVRWAGRSSGVVEKIQGWMLVAGGSVFALVNLGAPLAALGLVLDLAERGRVPTDGELISIAVGLLLFGAGVSIALLGWRFVKTAHQVIWAVTNRRLVRIVAGGAMPTQSWSKAEILNVNRLNWDDPAKRGLAVTVKGSGESNPVLIIIGPVDLEAAERALEQMEG